MEELIIRPRPAHFLHTYLASVGAAAAGWLGVMALIRLAAHPESSGAVGTFLALFLVVLIGFIVGYRLFGAVRVGSKTVTKIGWTGVRRFPIEQAARVYKFNFNQVTNADYPLFVIADNRGRCLMSMSGMVWDDADLDTLTYRLRVPLAYWTDSSYGAARRACPAGGLPLMISHPILMGVLMTPVVLAAVVLIVILLDR